MSIPIPPRTVPTVDEPLVNILFNYPSADVIICSSDSYHFCVPKIFIENSSSILSKLIQKVLDSSGATNASVSLPAVQLPNRGEIIYCILTFVFLIIPLLPPTHKKAIELLSWA